jgi:hypothetical protein
LRLIRVPTKDPFKVYENVHSMTEAREIAEIYASHLHMHWYSNDDYASKMLSLLRKDRETGFDGSNFYLEEMHKEFSKKSKEMLNNDQQ